MASNIVPDHLVKFDPLTAEEGDIVDDIFRCPVCSMPYNSADGRTPKMLPACHHTFCLSCLRAIDADQRPQRGYMECPLCRTRVDPGTKMENLATNFYLPRFKEVLNRSLTDMSIVSDGAGAAAASTSHGQSTTTEVGEFCSVHANKPATYWCQTCDCMICGICALNKHSRQSGHFPKRLDKNVMAKMTLELIDRTSEQLSVVRSTSFQLLENGTSFPIFDCAVRALMHHVDYFRNRVDDNFRLQTSEPILDFHAEELEACRSVLTVENDDITMDDVLEVHKKVSTVLQPTVNNLKKLVEDVEKEMRDFAHKKVVLCVKDSQAEGAAAPLSCPYCGSQTSEFQTDEFGVVESVRRCSAQTCNVKIVEL